jgi:hypothetical protein
MHHENQQEQVTVVQSLEEDDEQQRVRLSASILNQSHSEQVPQSQFYYV